MFLFYERIFATKFPGSRKLNVISSWWLIGFVWDCHDTLSSIEWFWAAPIYSEQRLSPESLPNIQIWWNFHAAAGFMRGQMTVLLNYCSTQPWPWPLLKSHTHCSQTRTRTPIQSYNWLLIPSRITVLASRRRWWTKHAPANTEQERIIFSAPS